MNLTFRKGVSGRRLHVFLTDSSGDTLRGKTGLRHDSPGARAVFLREGDSRPTVIALRHAEVGQYTPGGFREIDAALMPGVYEFHPPNEVFQGADSAVIMLCMPGAEPALVEIDLVAYDPQDSERLGLSCLSQESRHACLASAFREVIPPLIADQRK